MKLSWVSESRPFFAICAVLTIVGIGLHWVSFWPGRMAGWLLLAIGLLAGVVGVIFFRDPERTSTADEAKILAPADGRIMVVEEVPGTPHLSGPLRRIATFMDLSNVHVQRMPASGRLLLTEHKPGKYRPAFLPSAAKENEQRWYVFEHNRTQFALVQIAGLLARRTISWIRTQQTYSRGERLGMIAFSSEVDVYLPLSAKILVKPGDKVLAGKTVIGEWA